MLRPFCVPCAASRAYAVVLVLREQASDLFQFITHARGQLGLVDTATPVLSTHYGEWRDRDAFHCHMFFCGPSFLTGRTHEEMLEVDGDALPGKRKLLGIVNCLMFKLTLGAVVESDSPEDGKLWDMQAVGGSRFMIKAADPLIHGVVDAVRGSGMLACFACVLVSMRGRVCLCTWLLLSVFFEA
jgi:hypothetical protein